MLLKDRNFDILLNVGGFLILLLGLPVLFNLDTNSEFFKPWTFTSEVASFQIVLCGLAVLCKIRDWKRALQLFGLLTISLCIVAILKHTYIFELRWALYSKVVFEMGPWRIAPISLICFVLFGIGFVTSGNKKSNVVTKFFAALFISLPTAISFFTLVTKLTTLENVFSWSSHEFMSYPVAIALSSAGGVYILDVLRKTKKWFHFRTLAIPLFLSFFIFFISTFGWQFFLNLESQKILKAATFEMDLFKSVIDTRINEYGLSLKRMGNRIENDKYHDYALHYSDAKAYVSHLKGMKSIGVINNKNSTIKWLYKGTRKPYQLTGKNIRSLLGNEQSLGEFDVSQIFKKDGEPIFVLSSLLELNGNRSSKLFSVIDVDEFFDRIISNGGFSVSILLGSEVIFNKDVVIDSTMSWKNTTQYSFKGLSFEIEATPGKELLNREVTSLPVLVMVTGCLLGGAVGFFLFFGFISQEEKTNRIIAEKKLFAWQAAIVDSASYSIISTDINGVIQSFNPKAEKLLGYAASELIGKESPALFHAMEEIVSRANILTEELGQKINPGFDVFTTKTKILRVVDENEWTYINKSGDRVPVSLSVTALRNENDDITGYLGIAQDLTEKKQALAELQKITKQLRTLVNGSPVGILSMNASLKVTSWNPACEKIFGWTEAECLGSYPPFVNAEMMANSLELVEKIKTSLEPLKVVTERVRKDGQKIFVESSATPLINQEDEFEGVLVVIIDVTEKIILEKNLLSKNQDLEIAVDYAMKSQLAAVRASRTKSEFLANMSHEIRTPINGIIGMASLLHDTPLEEQQADFVESIRYSADSLLIIINDILDFSKVEAGKLEIEINDFDLNELLLETVKIFYFLAKKKDISIELIQDIKLLHSLKGDAGRLRQILTNLIGNAIKFTSSGVIKIKVSEPSKNDFLFEVIDQGIGISEEAQKRLFQPFEQADSSTSRKFGGTGLGLSISKRLVSLMNGSISVKSELGKGAKFYFNLPLERGDLLSKSNESKKNIHNDVRDLSMFRVLVAEDNLINQKVILLQLEKLGVKADAVASGKEVLEAINLTKYDLILMDCQMPEIDGYEATKMMRHLPNSALSKIPVIALTANALSGDKEHCIAAGMNDYLTKPLNLRDLRASLNFHLLGVGNIENNLDIIIPVTADLVNWDVVRELESLGNNDDGVNFLEELFENFVSESEIKRIKIKDYLLEKNIDEIRKNAHMLKATSGNLGAVKLSNVCGQIEIVGGDELTKLSQLIQAFDRELIAFMSEMKAYIKNMSSEA